MTSSPLRALIWAAVSTKVQTEDERISLPQQEADARALCERERWRLVEILKVPGHSRFYIDIHECAADMAAQGIDAFNRLLDHWQRQDFDVLIVRDGERFARTQALHAYVTERTIQVGARIYSLADGWVDQNNYRMWIAMGGYKAASDVDRLVNARRKAMDKFAERGLPTSSSVIISHQIVRDERGKMLRLEVDESKHQLWVDLAEVVLRGVGWNKIESELYERYGHVNDDGVPYNPATMYHLLYHPTFWGNSARYFKSQKYPNGVKTGLWAFDPTEPAPDGTMIFYGTHDPVYIGELADKIKAELRRRRGIQGRTRPDKTHRFTGLFVCAECGYYMVIAHRKVGDPRLYWRCITRYRGRRPDVTCTQNIFLKDEKAQAYIHDRLTEMLALGDPALFLPEDRQIQDMETRHAALCADIEATEAQIRRLILKQTGVDADLSGFYDEAIMRQGERLKILRSNLAALEREYASPAQYNDQRHAFDELAALSLEVFWTLETTQINQILHRLMGNRRFVVRDGEIIGTALAPSHSRRH